jgi:hypothetical protein
VENAESFETSKVTDIGRQQFRDAVDIHAGRQPGVMDLHALDAMLDKQGPPAVVDFPAVRQKFEITLDHAGEAIRLGNAQAEAVFVERAR